MPENRKLSTILFADIVGYTSLMQSDEPKALQLLKQFKTYLEQIVPSFNGEIVQYFGDACLLSFDSTSRGVQCAISLQEKFRMAEIPIRIGMHLGEVIFTENNVFGDGVNVASRIESMGVPGGILISKIVRDQIKNKTDYNLLSLGKFEFKNVLEPMEVFAIANEGHVVPKRKELQGKFKTDSTNRSRKWMAITSGVFLLAIITLLIVKSGQTTLSANQKDSQITILPFENKTGLSNMDQFGTMISDWVTSSLMETGKVKIVRATRINDQAIKATLLPESLNKIYFSSGIGVIINGRYYSQNENIYVQANIIDTETGQIIHSTEPVVNSTTNLELILDDLSQLIMGFWEVKDLKRFQKNPPRYNAYQQYITGVEAFDNELESAEVHLKKAHEIDTTFFSPLLKLIVFYANNGRIHARDSLISMLATKQTRFTRWDLLYYKFLNARSNSNWYEAGKHAEEATQIDPSDFTFFARAAQAYQNANYHQKAIDVMRQVDTSLVYKSAQEHIDNYIDYSLFMQGKYEEVYSRYQKYMAENAITPWMRNLYAQLLIETERTNELPEVILNSKSDSPFNKGSLLYGICNSFLIKKQDSLAIQYARNLKDFAIQNSSRPNYYQLLGESEMFQQNWSQAIIHFERHIRENGLTKFVGTHIRREDYSVFGDLATCLAYIGNSSEAIQLLDNMSWHPAHASFISYIRARIETINGNENKAIEAIAVATQKGHAFSEYSYSFDFHLIPLFSNPSFQKLVAVKG